MKLLYSLRQSILAYCFLLLFLMLGSHASIGQSAISPEVKDAHRNIASLELMGHGFIYSLNYERTFFHINRFITTAQIGVSYYPQSTGVIKLWIPMTLNQLFRVKRNHYIELGAGQVLLGEDLVQNETDNVAIINGHVDRGVDWIFRLGYRFQSTTSPWVFKVAYTPYLFNGWEYIHWGGLGLGIKF